MALVPYCLPSHTLAARGLEFSTSSLGTRVTSPRARRLADPARLGSDIIRVPSFPPTPQAGLAFVRLAPKENLLSKSLGLALVIE